MAIDKFESCEGGRAARMRTPARPAGEFPGIGDEMIDDNRNPGEGDCLNGERFTQDDFKNKI
ncbi:hypothetical protein [Coprobacter tertius]|uniref:Uncharacterized protein n=1 Tax=Coprobacter tertius TaxID=2944915 RepID=A0ABT1MFH1_9BACT|nr:hypothetical protein [Coprobacter tertius]MCP9611382.1 hypothetical protein [Coprobacter tertius]